MTNEVDVLMVPLVNSVREYQKASAKVLEFPLSGVDH